MNSIICDNCFYYTKVKDRSYCNYKDDYISNFDSCGDGFIKSQKFIEKLIELQRGNNK